MVQKEHAVPLPKQFQKGLVIPKDLDVSKCALNWTTEPQSHIEFEARLIEIY
jgi:hypothetical protein